jgi:class 3 adenylate cyclase
MEQWVDDGVAVLDAIGSQQAVVLAPFENSPTGVMLAATHRERVTGLVIMNGFARAAWTPDYPCGVRQTVIEPWQRLVAETDAVEQGHDVLSLFAPSVADDTAFRARWDRAGNLGATPATARAMAALEWGADVRHLLPMVSVPTLITQCATNPLFHTEHGRYLAEHIPDAKYVELPGTDVLFWVGDTGAMLDEIEEFVTGVRGGSGTERLLTTVLFTDIVGSTNRAAQLGDGRWRDLLDRHDQSVRTQIGRFGGREVKTVGDGFVATFDSPRRAIECAVAIRETLASFDIGVRAGIHTGEIELRGDDVAGMAVHIGARVSALAGSGEILVSSTVKDLVVGSSIAFNERGEHELKAYRGCGACTECTSSNSPGMPAVVTRRTL